MGEDNHVSRFSGVAGCATLEAHTVHMCVRD